MEAIVCAETRIGRDVILEIPLLADGHMESWLGRVGGDNLMLTGCSGHVRALADGISVP